MVYRVTYPTGNTINIESSLPPEITVRGELIFYHYLDEKQFQAFAPGFWATVESL